MSKVTLRHRWYRARGFFRKVICILRGTHIVSESDWGYAGDGMVDAYCPNCLKIVRRIPLDDFPGTGQVIDVLELARKPVE